MATKKAPPKRGASRNTSAPKKQPLPGWVWLASGLAIGAFVVFLMKLEPGNKAVQRAKPEEGRPAAAAGNGKPAATAAGKTEGTPPTPIKPKYDFYTLLPESEVIVPPDAVPRNPAAKPATPAKPDAAATTAQPGQAATATPATPATTPGQPAATPPKEATTKAQPPVTLFFLQAGPSAPKPMPTGSAPRSSCSARTCGWSRARSRTTPGTGYWSVPTAIATS